MERKRNIIFIIFTVIMIAFAVGGYFLGKRTAETENIPMGHKTVVPDNNNQQNNENAVYELKKGYSNITKEINYGLYIREDKTFRFKVYSESGTDYVGTYEVNGNTITFNTKVLFDTNGCYFNEGTKAVDANNFENFTGTLKATGITINHLGKTVELSINNDLTESDELLSTYSINPKSKMHTDCTNKDKI